MDPLAPKYPWNSPYAFSENSTIAFVELEGVEKYYAADGKLLEQFGSSNEIRIIEYGAWGMSKVELPTNDYNWVGSGGSFGVKSEDREKFLLDNSSPTETSMDELAYKWSQEYNGISMGYSTDKYDYGKQKVVRSIGREYSVGIYSSTLETGESVFFLGKTITGDGESSGIGNETFLGRARTGIAHTHGANGGNMFSWDVWFMGGALGTDDFVIATKTGVPLYLASPNGFFQKLVFDPITNSNGDFGNFTVQLLATDLPSFSGRNGRPAFSDSEKEKLYNNKHPYTVPRAKLKRYSYGQLLNNKPVRQKREFYVD